MSNTVKYERTFNSQVFQRCGLWFTSNIPTPVPVSLSSTSKLSKRKLETFLLLQIIKLSIWNVWGNTTNREHGVCNAGSDIPDSSCSCHLSKGISRVSASLSHSFIMGISAALPLSAAVDEWVSSCRNYNYGYDTTRSEISNGVNSDQWQRQCTVNICKHFYLDIVYSAR